IGGGVAFALATDWRACTGKTTFNYGNLRHGLNPLFMFSRAMPLLVGYAASFQIYLEDIVLSSRQALVCGLAHKIVASMHEVKHAAAGHARISGYVKF
ncbi:hypothetical protein AURANDRAFT_33076, partial [Aureococcus anophagefferens]